MSNGNGNEARIFFKRFRFSSLILCTQLQPVPETGFIALNFNQINAKENGIDLLFLSSQNFETSEKRQHTLSKGSPERVIFYPMRSGVSKFVLSPYFLFT
jgi:hypothetical protein